MRTIIKKTFQMVLIAAVVAIVPGGLSAGEFSVATWNIHAGKKLDRNQTELLSQPIGGSDIVTFQEVKSKGGISHSEIFAAAAGYPYFFQSGSNGFISRLPILDQGKVEVNYKGRSCPWIDVQLPGGPMLRVYSPHLSYKLSRNPFISKQRGKEMQVILDHAEDFDGAIVIAGDLNTLGFILFGHSREHSIRYAKAAGFVDAHAGLLRFPRHSTQHIVGRVDWILSRGLSVGSALRGNYGGSDHRWLRASFNYGN